MPEIPDPFTGLVISYSYLWRREYNKGREEGAKDRPCAIVLATKQDGADVVVTVVAITHSEPDSPDMAVKIPQKVKEYLHLDSERSWVICNEVNRFVWPGPDLRPITRKGEEKFIYGVLPPKLQIKAKNTIIRSLAKIVSRTS